MSIIKWWLCHQAGHKHCRDLSVVKIVQQTDICEFYGFETIETVLLEQLSTSKQ